MYSTSTSIRRGLERLNLTLTIPANLDRPIIESQVSAGIFEILVFVFGGCCTSVGTPNFALLENK